MPGYDLCPSVPLTTVVAQARQALLWTRQNAARLNGDPERIYVAGNSAGAHLAAMMMMAVSGWRTSCAIEAVSSPKVVTRVVCASSV